MGVPGNTNLLGVNPFFDGDVTVTNSVVEIFTGQGNLYGLLVQNNGTADVYLQIFNKKTSDAVTLGTTAPFATYLIPASGIFGKDKNDSPLMGLDRGMKVAITATRTGAGAPAVPATCQFWYRNA